LTVKPGINQNRSYVGVGYKLTPQLNVDTGYQVQFINNAGAPDALNHVWLTNINVNF
jgi:long-subunit fatty acid transport protein